MTGSDSRNTGLEDPGPVQSAVKSKAAALRLVSSELYSQCNLQLMNGCAFFIGD